ncbi:hypothetical protein HZS_2735 [Henneguya salminicola]|nr:hypothetical protein HZS_2735 [Henneguya salminicola]
MHKIYVLSELSWAELVSRNFPLIVHVLTDIIHNIASTSHFRSHRTNARAHCDNDIRAAAERIHHIKKDIIIRAFDRLFNFCKVICIQTSRIVHQTKLRDGIGRALNEDTH